MFGMDCIKRLNFRLYSPSRDFLLACWNCNIIRRGLFSVGWPLWGSSRSGVIAVKCNTGRQFSCVVLGILVWLGCALFPGDACLLRLRLCFPSPGHNLRFCNHSFHCTTAGSYLAVSHQQCLLFTRGFTHRAESCLIWGYWSRLLFTTSPPPLSLQVKVWFQNRRTKFKRQKLEEEGSESQQKKKGSHHVNRWRLATKQSSPEEIDVTSDD